MNVYLRVLTATVLGLVALTAVLAVPSVGFGAILALSPSPSVSVAPGGTASLDVMLRDYTGSDPIIGFSLDLTASDPALTGGGAFDGFSFTRSPALDGVLTMPFPAVPGQFVYATDPFAPVPEFGITPDLLAGLGGQITLGTLSIVAPMTAGTYDVVLAPGFGQTYLQLDNLDSTTIPPDGTLDITNSAIEVTGSPVVPEPTGMAVWLVLVSLAFITCRRR